MKQLYKLITPITLLCLFMQVSAQELPAPKWKLTGIDAYFSINGMNGNKLDYRALDKAYAAENSPNQRFSYAPAEVQGNIAQFAVKGYHASLVFSKFVYGKWLHSKEIRAGISYRATSKYDGMYPEYRGYTGDKGTDSLTSYLLTYGHDEQSVNIDFTYLWNFKLSPVFAIYTGGMASVAPYQTVNLYYSYGISRYSNQDGGSRSVYSERGSYRLNAASANADALVGCKLNANCRWNFYLELLYQYRAMVLEKNMSFSTPGAGLQLGVRYKLGDVGPIDNENPKGIFW